MHGHSRPLNANKNISASGCVGANLDRYINIEAFNCVFDPSLLGTDYYFNCVQLRFPSFWYYMTAHGYGYMVWILD